MRREPEEFNKYIEKIVDVGSIETFTTLCGFTENLLKLKRDSTLYMDGFYVSYSTIYFPFRTPPLIPTSIPPSNPSPIKNGPKKNILLIHVPYVAYSREKFHNYLTLDINSLQFKPVDKISNIKPSVHFWAKVLRCEHHNRDTIDDRILEEIKKVEEIEKNSYKI
ncbi:MAG: hypothetical protein GTN36_03925 [Candidatus Aenigmarchaeota archaeon]|nr:hypothetical protein [Candidatus Aenigmarchaeota archaeon]